MLPLQLHNKVFKFNSMWRGNKRILFSNIFHTENNLHALIEPLFVFVYKAYDSAQ